MISPFVAHDEQKTNKRPGDWKESVRLRNGDVLGARSRSVWVSKPFLKKRSKASQSLILDSTLLSYFSLLT